MNIGANTTNVTDFSSRKSISQLVMVTIPKRAETVTRAIANTQKV
jgi:hypothetical protein